MITFNHEKYIENAIDGILRQKTNFAFELIIGEDFSTDNSRKVIESYQNLYSQKIKVVFNEINRGMMLNFIETLNRCTGKYIALCEGDDYWSDPYKLQKQVDFLETNEDFAICHHNMQVIYDDGRETHLSNAPDQKEVTTIEDLAKGNYIYTASCLFRNGLIKFPVWFIDSPVGDYVLHMLNAQYGKIKYIPDLMGVYRVHKGGLWGNTNYETMLHKWIKMQDNLIGMFDSIVNNLILSNQLQNLITYYQLIKVSGNKNEFEDYFPKSFSSLPSLVVEYKEEIERLNFKISTLKNSTFYKIRNILVKPIKRILK